MSKVSRGFKDFRPMKDGLMGILDLINGDESLGHWVTINGVHVLIHEGESVEEAFKRQTGKTVEGKPEVKNIEHKITLKEAENPGEHPIEHHFAKAPEGYGYTNGYEKIIPTKLETTMVGKTEISVVNITSEEAKAAFVDTLEVLPEQHVETLDKIRLINGVGVKSPVTLKDGTTVTPKVYGYYTTMSESHGSQYWLPSKNYQTVTIYSESPHIEQTIAHEVGHQVNRVLMSRGEAASWTLFYNKNKDAMPTKYSMMNSVEGFAECYSKYYIDRSNLNPKITAWFDTRIEKRGKW